MADKAGSEEANYLGKFKGADQMEGDRVGPEPVAVADNEKEEEQYVWARHTWGVQCCCASAMSVSHSPP